jgi:undecaprenyl-diphosphatase
MDEIIKIVAKYLMAIPILLALYVFIRFRTKRQRLEFVVLVIGSGILSLLLAKIGSHFISDPRPFVVGHFQPLLPHGNDNGFPSDHALLTSFLGFALLPYSKKLGLIALVLAALIGAARMAAGIHHLEDIVGSFVITGISVLIVNELFKLATKRQNNPATGSKTEA